MNIFICWSGERGHKLANALQTNLPRMIPDFATEAPKDNLFVSDDIEKGTRWLDAVEDQLETADAGLVCITRESLNSGWIHFEAGALARAVRKKNTRVKRRSGTLYTYLLGVEPGELKGPLSEFQSTRFDREDTRRLCSAIASSVGGNHSAAGDWEKAFDEAWGEFKATVNAIGPLPASKLIPGLEDIFRRKTFNEPLDECTRQTWIDRFTGARETIAGLKAYAAAVNADNTYILDLYNELVVQLDAYAMNLGALLLKEERFEVSPEDGKLIIGNGIKKACESRRAKIRALVTHLLAPNCAPVLDKQSRQYAKLPSFDAKKTILIHPAEQKIKNKKSDVKLNKAQLNSCAASLWEFDRIYFYLVKENSGESDLDSLVRYVEYVEQELEKAIAVDGSASLIPLHYSIRALKSAIKRVEKPESILDESPRICTLMSRIERFIDAHELDQGQQVRDNLQDLRLLVGGEDTHASGHLKKGGDEPSGAPPIGDRAR
jgi:hypothetical protein